MSAKDHLNSDQLRMFMRPHEIYDLVVDSIDRADGETLEDTWVNKKSELSHGYRSLADSVLKEGVKRPVTIMLNHGHYKDFTMGQGHHRVKSAEVAEFETGKEYYVPVVYDWHWDETDNKQYDPM